MFPRYPVSRLPRRPSRNGLLRYRRKTQLRPRRPPPRRRAFYRQTYPAIRSLKKRWSFALVSKFTPNFQSQYSEALSVIERRVFSGALPILLLEMAVHLDKLSQANDDYASINELLATVISLCTKSWRNDLLLLDFKYCVDNFAKQLLEVFKRTANLIDDQVVASGAANAPIIKLYIESQKLCCSIFKSLNYQKLPESFKDLMVEFRKYLSVKYPVLEDCSVDGFMLDELRASICENIGLYVIKEEGFWLLQGYLSGFVEDVLSLLVSSSSSRHGREQLTVAAIKFLITVCKSGHHALFSRYDVLEQICESIVIPNVMLQDDEEELFDMDPMEFVKRDMEGSDMNTRRVIACELLKEIGMHYKDKLSEIVKHRVDICCGLYAFDAKGKWKYKDCAIRLLVSLATKNAGETSVQSDLVDVETVFDSHIALELGMSDVASFPILKAGALKFLTLFRNQISKPRVLQLLPDLSRLVASPNQVVFSYAAICIQRLLLVRDLRGTSTTNRYTWKDIRPVLPILMSNLFRVLDYHESEENEYVMKCIMCVIWAGDLSPDAASLCIKRLTAILHKVCESPKDSLFIQYLFDSLLVLIKRVCVLSQRHYRTGTPFPIAISLVSLLEHKLYPILQSIMARDISGFFPYAFRLLAELADLERYPLRYPLPADCYSKVFDILLVPDAWTRSTKVPVNAFLQKHEVSVLAIFDKLVSSLAAEDQGYYALNTVIEHLGFEVISPFVSCVWVSLFDSLQFDTTEKDVENIIVLMSRFLVKECPKNLVKSVDAGQPCTFQVMLEEFWIPKLKMISGPIELLKLASVASTRVICESPDILDMELWGEMLDNIMTLLSRLERASVDDDEHAKVDVEPLAEIKDPKHFLVVSLSKLFAASAQQGRVYREVISENLKQANQAALLQLFHRLHKMFDDLLGKRDMVACSKVSRQWAYTTRMEMSFVIGFSERC